MSTLPDRVTAPSWLSTLRMPFQVEGLPPVRRRLLAEVQDHDIGADAGYDAALVLAELVSNALKHGRPLDDGGLRLAWGRWDDQLHIHVTDGGAETEPTAAGADSGATSGRGLAIVRAVSTSWGFEHDFATTTVWAALAVPVAAEVASRVAPRRP